MDDRSGSALQGRVEELVEEVSREVGRVTTLAPMEGQGERGVEPEGSSEEARHVPVLDQGMIEGQIDHSSDVVAQSLERQPQRRDRALSGCRIPEDLDVLTRDVRRELVVVVAYHEEDRVAAAAPECADRPLGERGPSERQEPLGPPHPPRGAGGGNDPRHGRSRSRAHVEAVATDPG